MKTAETILRKKLGAQWVNIDLSTLIDGMKEYAEQALDLAAEKAKLSILDPYTNASYEDYEFETEDLIVNVSTYSILSLKDQLK